MRALVTGASGFIGQAFCSALESRSVAVRGAVRNAEVTSWVPYPSVPVGAVDGGTDWSAALTGITHVIHLVARTHVLGERNGGELRDYRLINVEGTRNLAEQAARAGVKRFLFVSSIKVNGEQTLRRPFTSSDPPHPQDAYGISKWEAEQALMAVGQSTGMETVVVRPPLVYGPRVKGNFARLVDWVHRGVPLPFSAIDNRRSLVSVFNLCDLLIRCVEHPNAAGRAFLVSDGEDVSTPELVRRLASALGREERLVRVPSRLLWLAARAAGREGIYRRLCGSLQVDMAETRRLLDWEPSMTLDEGLRRTVADSPR